MSKELIHRLIEIEDDLEKINELFHQRHWSDGLPIIPPTRQRVDRMMSTYQGNPQDIVAIIAPAFKEATLELLAVNAVMAGCKPEHFPIIIAATKALADARLNLQAIQATTNPVAMWVLINGPVRHELGFNAKFNCLGEGNAANLSVGRCIRLIMRNIGGALPSQMDRATHGQPGRISFCCAENEEESPWTSYHQDQGLSREQNAVTLIGVEGTMNMNSHSKNAHELLKIFANTMIHPPSNEYTHGGEPWIILGPEHAQILAQAGMSKLDVQSALWQLSKMPASLMGLRDFERVKISRQQELGDLTMEALLPISRSPEDIKLIVAGSAGTHSIYLPCFGNSRACTVAI